MSPQSRKRKTSKRKASTRPRKPGPYDQQPLLSMLGGAPTFGGRPALVRARAAVPSLPAARRQADGAAPVYRLKVSLAGSRPPICRRLELSADT